MKPNLLCLLQLAVVRLLIAILEPPCARSILERPFPEKCGQAVAFGVGPAMLLSILIPPWGKSIFRAAALMLLCGYCLISWRPMATRFQSLPEKMSSSRCANAEMRSLPIISRTSSTKFSTTIAQNNITGTRYGIT